MKPTVGEIVVHPQHGTAEVTAIEKREVGGVEREYVVLRRAEDTLTVHVPIESLADVGLRETIDEDAIAGVYDVLKADPEGLTTTWRKQHARNESRLSSGDILEVAAAVRDLKARDRVKGLSPSDGRIYRDARERLIEELSASTGDDPDEVEERIDAALAPLDELTPA